jgi:hypothetical protein
MAEPTTTLNMIWDAWVQAKRVGGVKAHAKAIVTTGAPIMSAIVVNAALKSIIMAMRDDDEDESYGEKYLESFFGEIKDNLNPLTLIPIAKDIVSIFRGYDVERMDMALISDFKNAIDAFDSEEKTLYEKWSGLNGATSSFFGVPAKNVERDIRGLITTFFGKTEDSTVAGILNAIEEGWSGEEKSNGQQLYEAMLKGDTEQIARVEGRFDSQSDINSAIRKALRENDPRIHEAALSDIEGDVSEYDLIVSEILGEGYFSEEDVKAAIKAEINELAPEKEEEGEAKKQSIYEARHYYRAITEGNVTLADKIKEDIVETSIANGKDRDEAEAAFKDSLSKHLRNEFVSSALSRTEATSMLTKYVGVDSNDAYWTLKRWDYYIANGSEDGYSMYNTFYEAVRTGKNLKSVINEYTSHGVKTSTLASQITRYYKPLYEKMSKSERANLKGYLLNAYSLLGYNRTEKSKDIDKWIS